MKKANLMILTIFMMIMLPLTVFGETSPDHRALLIGNGNYDDGNNLIGPINDLVKMEEAMGNNYFGDGNKAFKDIYLEKDLTSSQIIESIETSFKDAKAEDVSYLYYSGHGYYDHSTGLSNLAGVDGLGVDVDELESALSEIPGRVVIILDSCNSGGFINRSFGQADSPGYSEEYNKSVIKAFTTSRRRDFLTKDKYKVITASSKDEYSFEYKYPDGWGGGFTRAFVEGIGYEGGFLSDVNYDHDVSLAEIYDYTKNRTKDSRVQVYPSDDDFVIASSFKDTSKNNKVLKWEKFDQVELDKVWTVRFNDKIEDTSWQDKVYILDSYDEPVETSVSKNADGRSLTIRSLNDYKPSNSYSLWIQDNIYSERGRRHKDKVLVNFFTKALQPLSLSKILTK